jgi:hypothetical protein
MAPLQIPKNFKFKPLCPLPFQDGAKPSSSPPLFDMQVEYREKKEHSQKFQDRWTTRLPWAKSVVDDNG